MTLLSWFSRKESDSSTALQALDAGSGLEPTQPMGLEQMDSRPPAPLAESRSAARAAENAVVREQLRIQALARREQLYAVVRESLQLVGVLAADYKFKVLALDQGGRQYLVMIDLAPNLSDDVAKMATVEALIVDSGLSRFDLAVTAVYWRRDERLAATPSADAVATPMPTPTPLEEPKAAAQAPADDPSGSRYEPLQTEEMLAFKRALAVTGPALATPSVARAPARGFSPLATGYEDTQVVGPDTRPPGLGLSQYGDLN